VVSRRELDEQLIQSLEEEKKWEDTRHASVYHPMKKEQIEASCERSGTELFFLAVDPHPTK
jgi:hypothetical protein